MKDLRYVAVGLGYSPKRRHWNWFDLFVLLEEAIVTQISEAALKQFWEGADKPDLGRTKFVRNNTPTHRRNTMTTISTTSNEGDLVKTSNDGKLDSPSAVLELSATNPGIAIQYRFSLRSGNSLRPALS